MRNHFRYLLIVAVLTILSSLPLAGIVAAREGIKPTAIDGLSTSHESVSRGWLLFANLMPQQQGPTADLSVTKTVNSDQVAPGMDLTYTITVHNPEPNTVANVTLNDPLPAGTTFVSLTKPDSWMCTTPSVGTNGTVTCTNPSLAANSDSIFTLVVNVPSNTQTGVFIDNTATVSSTVFDPNESNNSATATFTVTGADLSVTKVASSDAVTAGSDITYTITVHNNAPYAADNVTLNDPLPAGTTFVSLTKPDSWMCTTPSVGTNGTVTCTNPSLAANSDSVFTLVVNVPSNTPQGTFFTNTATVSSTMFDPNDENNSGTATTVVPVIVADLSVTKVANSDVVEAGSDITYTITVHNGESYTVDNATLTDALPADTTFVSLTKPDSWMCTTPSVGANGTITCTNPNLAANSDSVFTLVINVSSNAQLGTLIANTATVSASMPDPNEDNNTAAATSTVSGADLEVTKVDTPDPVNVGGNITYTIIVNNNGPFPAADASWSDTLPAGTTFVSLAKPDGWICTTPSVGASGMVSCSRDPFPVESAVFTLVVKVDSSVSEGTVFTNTATASSKTPDPNQNNNDGTATTTVANRRAWTATANSGATEDESNPARPTYTNFTAAISPGSPAGTYVLRYNIQATDGLTGAGSNTRLRVRFRDEGEGSRVIITIMQSPIVGGAATLGAIFDSDNFEPSSGFQTQEIVMPALTFDFVHSTYWLEVTLVKTGTANQPGFGSAQINRQ